MLKQTFRYLGICLLVAITSACSKQQWYEAIQENRKQECQKLPLTRQEQCRESHSLSYEDYVEQREAPKP